MDKFRTVATYVAERVARSRPATALRMTNLHKTDDEDGQRGQGLAEYALILALVAIIAIVSLALLGGTISDLFWAPISEDFGEVLDDILG